MTRYDDSHSAQNARDHTVIDVVEKARCMIVRKATESAGNGFDERLG